MPDQRLHIIASCTDRKREAVDRRFRLHQVRADLIASGRQDTPEACAISWINRLSQVQDVPQRSARDMYCGSHWVGVCDLLQAARERADPDNVTLWICSAGYGLLHDADMIVSYAATFAARHQDAVPGEHGSWWEMMRKHRRRPKGQARCIADLAKMESESVILVVASSDYIKAMSADLVLASKNLSESGALLICSATSHAKRTDPSLRPLARHILPVDSRMRLVAGEAITNRGLVNVTAAKKLFEGRGNTWRSLTAAKRRLKFVVVGVEKDRMPQRQRMKDDEVRSFIRAEMGKCSWTGTKSRLLRSLRDSNCACEQSRFGELFDKEIKRYGTKAR